MKKQELIIERILESIDEGVHVVDQEGNTLIYNPAMARMEKMESQDVLTKSFQEVFGNINWEESTLMQALHNRKSMENLQQTYFNKDGKQITTINTTFPIISDDKVIAAVEIARNVTNLEKLTNTIVELQGVPIESEKAKIHKVKKYNFENLIGENQNFRNIIHTAKKASNSTASVFIYGETGTGKELIAQSIHFHGERKDKPFLAQNCAALPESLLEGILFGTAKGGFTGAIDRAGLFEQAHGGTLLLDEISAMPYELQGKLLRVLQEDYVRRVGGTKDIPVDVRIIATVNERAMELIQRGNLRKDLYYRLNIIGIDMIPLRERKDDILLLTEYFIAKHNFRYKKKVSGISPEAEKLLMDYDFPGNVRELENLIMAAISLAEDSEELNPSLLLLNRDNLPTPEHGREPKSNWEQKLRKDQVHKLGIDEYLQVMEKEALMVVLSENQGNISQTAKSLKIKRQTLQHKLKKYGLK